LEEKPLENFLGSGLGIRGERRTRFRVWFGIRGERRTKIV